MFVRFGSCLLTVLLTAPSAFTAAQVPPHQIATLASASGAPVHLTAAQDRERLLHLLGIPEAQMRPAPVLRPKGPNSVLYNFDEAKSGIYGPAPDPLRSHDGKRITTAEEWWSQRRPEIVADFEREILGHAPSHLPRVKWQVVSAFKENYGGIPAITKRLVGHVDNSIDPAIPVNIDLILTTPAHASGPVPVIMELAFAKDFAAAVQRPLPPPLPPGTPWQWGVDGRLVLQRGWGFAVLSPTSYQADNGAGLTQGIIGLMNHGQPRGLDDWGVLRAWAWGASRALDYLETDPAVDAQQVGIEGHSRFGKTVLVAMAYDPRFAIGYSSSSGEAGAKLYRHQFGEQIENMTANHPPYHWFAGRFLRYGGPLTPRDLPVDANELIALAAPRPVFIGAGSTIGDGYVNTNGDALADPRGMFLAEVAAGPVYRLLGAKDLGTVDFPPMQTALVSGELAFREHPYGHTPAPNWPTFLEYASRYLHAPPSLKVLARSR